MIVALALAPLLLGVGTARGAESGACPSWAQALTAAPTTAPTATTPTATTTTPVATTMAPVSSLPAIAGVADATMVGARSALLVASLDGSDNTVTAEYWQAGSAMSCTPVQNASGTRAEFLLAGLQPDNAYRFRLLAKGAGGASSSPAGRFVTLPADVIAEGVTIAGTPFGRLSHAAALAKLNRLEGAPVRITYAGAYRHVLPSKLGLHVHISGSIATALGATPGTELPAPATSVDRAKLRAYVASLDRRWSRKPEQASAELVGTHAVIRPKQSGVAVEASRMTSEIAGELETGKRALLRLAVKKSLVSAGTQERAVVVRLGSQTLTAYLNGKPILKTPVTTGRPALPTPIGSFKVIFRASPYVFHSPWPPGSPYYYPPAPVTWAMEFYDGDFLHDDPAEPSGAFGSDSQDGYFASHGCVHVPHDVMAFLYDWLPVGAPVIVAQN